jgi:hypothetical protein
LREKKQESDIIAGRDVCGFAANLQANKVVNV